MAYFSANEAVFENKIISHELMCARDETIMYT